MKTLSNIDLDNNRVTNLPVPIAGSEPESSSRTISAKTSAYTVVVTDISKVIQCSGGSFTISLTALASLPTGFTCWIWNLGSNSTDVITVDPDASELIDGLATLVLYRGEGVEIINTGGNWRTLATRHHRGLSENIDPAAVRPVASGDSSIALGAASIASGQYSFAAGQDSAGNGSTAGGIGAVALGGGYVDTLNGFATGPYSTTRLNRGCVARASGRIATTGDAQARTLTLYGQTTSATPLVITTDASSVSSSNIIRMPNNSAYTFNITVIAHRTDTVGTFASYQFIGCVTRSANAASTAIRGTIVKTVLFETDTAYDCDVTADTTNGGAIVTVTGKAAHTVTWCARVETVEATS